MSFMSEKNESYYFPQLNNIRNIAEQMLPPKENNWQWIGEHMSQRMFGISEKRAKAYAEKHGGEAKEMTA